MLIVRDLFRPAEINREDYRLYISLNYLCYLGFIAHIFFVPLFYSLGIPKLVFLNIFSASAWACSYFLNRAAHHNEAFIMVFVETITHSIIATYFLGWESGFQYYLFSLALFVFINHRQTVSTMILLAVLVFTAYISLFLTVHQANSSISLSAYTLDHLYFINVLVNFTGFGILAYFFRIASISAENEMEVLATTDALTKLLNRRKIRELIEHETMRYQRDRKSFLLSIGDIDHFKRFNDDYGHDCGDYVLQQVSLLMKNTLRMQDAIARWGGEEFLIMLPDTDVQGGIQAIEKLREIIADTQYTFKGNQFSVTMTFGVTVYNGSYDVDNCIKRADEAMYTGKRDGRNRVVATHLSEQRVLI